jgi:poly(hydroxyalkanoate) granule-associated protein
MPTRSKTRKRKAVNARRSRLEKGWKGAQRLLRSAESSLGRRVAEIAEQSGIPTRDVARRAKAWRVRLGQQGRKARARMSARLADLQKRAGRERRTLAHRIDDSVARALAALNIPSRRELQQLSRRVEELSARIDRLRRRAA